MKKLPLILALLLSLASFCQHSDSAAYFLQKGNEAKQARLYLVASQQYRKAIQFDTSNIEAQRELGNVSMEMRRFPDAITAYSAVVNKSPGDPVAVENLVSLYFLHANGKMS